MIKLHQFTPAWTLPNASPFCMKVETYLRMVGLSYEVINGELPLRAPKKKLPYIEDGAKVIADSGFILDYLKQTYGDKLDVNLSPADRAVAHALRRLIEESLYWPMLYSRWMEDSIWVEVRRQFFDTLPPVLKQIVSGQVRKGLRKALYVQGMGRHNRDEIYELGKADLSALSTWLGHKRYFMGEAVSSLDATAYAFLANILVPPFDLPLKRHAMSLENLWPYCERMREQYFGR